CRVTCGGGAFLGSKGGTADPARFLPVDFCPPSGQSGEDRGCAFPCPGCNISPTKRCPKAAPSGRSITLTRSKFIGTTLVAGAALTTDAQQARPQPASKRTIVDAQVHFWKASSPDWPWEPGVRPQLPEPFTIERALPMMDEAGVDRVVIVPPGLN